jgi:hypothetical protein
MDHERLHREVSRDRVMNALRKYVGLRTSDIAVGIGLQQIDKRATGLGQTRELRSGQ